MEKDIRGFDLKVEHLRIQLANIINNSNLPSSVVFFVLKDVMTEVELLYHNASNKQYEDFCNQANENEQEVKKEEQSSSSSND